MENNRILTKREIRNELFGILSMCDAFIEEGSMVGGKRKEEMIKYLEIDQEGFELIRPDSSYTVFGDEGSTPFIGHTDPIELANHHGFASVAVVTDRNSIAGQKIFVSSYELWIYLVQCPGVVVQNWLSAASSGYKSACQ